MDASAPPDQNRCGLEVEKTEEKLAGRVRIDQPLDDRRRSAFLDVRNAVARRLPTPPPEHIAAMDASLHRQYIKPFQHADELETGHRFWMGFRAPEDLVDWCSLIAAHLPSWSRELVTCPRTT